MTTKQGAAPREAGDPHCLREGEAARLLERAPWRRFVVLGDGVAEGRGDPVEGYGQGGWAGRVAAALREVRPELAYLNLAKRSLVAAQVRSQQLEAALNFTCDLAAVVCGAQDVLRRSFDPDATEVELSRVIAPLRDAGCDVLTMSQFDITRSGLVPEEESPALRERLRVLAERTQAVSLRHGALHVDLTLHPAAADPGVHSADHRHPSARGHAVAGAEAVRRLGARLLER
ncbi:SGNH/GDSL hydrolase family protein [Wenjunlia tyrosinilytica]|uniref:Lipase/acylhydrolase n=1 Tax=Wenjunlia tyrosinilytica TaxID=1544741 RepID=A0A917ZR70_9ACTN|nr:SGNH/GDSL hydrolase family protein [Wenjunlia tyrosinilytica]GGO90696.1 lipase/acylhydrolase [Wenjunlia tyrosinilytica]